MNYKEAFERRPNCGHALSAVLEHKRPFRFINAEGKETDSKHGSGAPNWESEATSICRDKPGSQTGPQLWYVVDGRECPLGLKG